MAGRWRSAGVRAGSGAGVHAWPGGGARPASEQAAGPAYLTFVSNERYYWALVFATPAVFLVQWLLGGAAAHLALRLAKQPSDFDRILNTTAFPALVVGVPLVLWDWMVLARGGASQYVLGFSHLPIDAWWFVLVVAALRRTLGLFIAYSITGATLAVLAGFPFGVIVMRAPY